MAAAVLVTLLVMHGARDGVATFEHAPTKLSFALYALLGSVLAKLVALGLEYRAFDFGVSFTFRYWSFRHLWCTITEETAQNQGQ